MHICLKLDIPKTEGRPEVFVSTIYAVLYISSLGCGRQVQGYIDLTFKFISLKGILSTSFGQLIDPAGGGHDRRALYLRILLFGLLIFL